MRSLRSAPTERVENSPAPGRGRPRWERTDFQVSERRQTGGERIEDCRAVGRWPAALSRARLGFLISPPCWKAFLQLARGLDGLRLADCVQGRVQRLLRSRQSRGFPLDVSGNARQLLLADAVLVHRRRRLPLLLLA